MFADGAGIPKLIIANDKSIIEKIVKNLKEQSYHEFQIGNDKRDIFVNEKMKNIIIFYKEQGYMSDGTSFNLLKHLRQIEKIEDIYYERGQKEQKQGYVRNEIDWHKLRNPYLDWDVLKNDYQKYIVIADDYETILDYENAIDFYKKARGIKYGEKYPKEQIKLIREKLKEEKKEGKLDRFIALADKYFKDKDFDNAGIFYEKALQEEKDDYVEDQLKKITNNENIFNSKYKEATKAYNKAKIEQTKKSFEDAKKIAKEALNIKSKSEICLKLLNSIDRYLKPIYINDAEAYFKDNDFDNARIFYEKVLKVIKKNDSAVAEIKDRLKKIEKLKLDLEAEVERNRKKNSYHKLIIIN